MDIGFGKYKITIRNTSTAIVSGDSKALIVGGNMFGNLNLLTNYKFADVILYQLIQKIIDAMSGIVWTMKGTELTLLQANLKIIFEKNFGDFYKALYFNGMAVFVVNFDTQHVKLLKENKYKIETDGSITLDKEFEGYRVFITYSETYKMFGKTDSETCKDMFAHIDNLMNAINCTTENLGAMGILSPESVSGVMSNLGEKEREKLQTEWREKYGLKVGKWSILMTQTPTKFQQINLPIKDLELTQKLENAIKIMAGYHKVPYELIALSGQSTYANRKEAMNELIDLTCKAYANKLFDIASQIFFTKPIKVNYSFESISNEADANRNELRSTVGGLDRVITLQQSVANGITDYDSAKNIIKTFFGFTEDEATKLLGTIKVNPIQQLPTIQ